MKNDRVKAMASIPLRRDDLQLHHIIRAVRLCSKLFEQSVYAFPVSLKGRGIVGYRSLALDIRDLMSAASLSNNAN